jgi:hypothetical protein
LRYGCKNLGRLDGEMLISHGKGISQFTFREFLNICYTTVVRQFQPPMDEEGDSVEVQISRFEEKIGLRHNPENDAMAALRQWQISQGIDPDAKTDFDPNASKPWWEQDLEM